MSSLNGESTRTTPPLLRSTSLNTAPAGRPPPPLCGLPTYLLRPPRLARRSPSASREAVATTRHEHSRCPPAHTGRRLALRLYRRTSSPEVGSVGRPVGSPLKVTIRRKGLRTSTGRCSCFGTTTSTINSWSDTSVTFPVPSRCVRASLLLHAQEQRRYGANTIQFTVLTAKLIPVTFSPSNNASPDEHRRLHPFPSRQQPWSLGSRGHGNV